MKTAVSTSNDVYPMNLKPYLMFILNVSAIQMKNVFSKELGKMEKKIGQFLHAHSFMRAK